MTVLPAQADLPPESAADTRPHGFYTIHRIQDGTAADNPGDPFLGKGIFLGPRSYLSPDGQIRVALEGTIAGSGTIEARFDERGEASYVWRQARIEKKDASGPVLREFSGAAALAPVPEPGSPDLFLTLVGQPEYAPRQVRSFRLKFVARSLPVTRTSYVAHRGTSHFPPNTDGIYPGNSLEAFGEALRQGFDGFELDVRLSSDRKWIVSHDDKLDVATECAGSVGSKTLRELESCVLDASTQLPELTAVKAPVKAMMPSLSHVLHQYLRDPRLKHVVLDIKPQPDEEAIAAMQDAMDDLNADASALSSKIIFISRSEAMIAGLRPLYPNADFALEGDTGLEPPFHEDDYFPEPGVAAKRFHDMVSLNVGFLTTFLQLPLPSIAIERFTDKAHEKGYKVMGWTVSTGPGLYLAQHVQKNLDVLLTDAPFSRIAKLQLKQYF